MKKVVVAGATGLIGGRLCAALHQKGYAIYVFTRNIGKSKREVPFAAGHFNWKEGDEWKAALDGAFAVINLAGAPLNDKRWDEKYKKVIYDSRVKYTAALAEAINKCDKKPEVFLCSSAIGIYGDRDDEVLDEDSSTSDDFIAKLCTDWEKAAQEASSSTRVVNARTGIVLSPEGGALKELLTPFKLYVGGPLSNGKMWWSWIHIDEAAEMMIFALENENVKGAFNLVGPKPVTNKYFSKMLGKVLNKPSFFHVPKFVIKLVLGEAAEYILFSSRVIPAKAEKFGYKFKYSDPETALRDLLV